MFHKSILGALAAAAAAAVVLAVLQLKNRDEKEEEDRSEKDDEIHFIEINDEPAENEKEEKPHEVHVEEVKMDEGEDEADHVSIESFNGKNEEEKADEAPVKEEEKAEAPEKEEPAGEEKDEEVPAEVKEIASLYPYLDTAFIQEVLAKDPEYKEKYPEDTLITIVHSASFENHENAMKFASVMEDAGYHCEGDDQKVTAEVRMFCEDGSIISDILNVANQVRALEGTYQGTEIRV
jgi:hypothetical protein